MKHHTMTRRSMISTAASIVVVLVGTLAASKPKRPPKSKPMQQNEKHLNAARELTDAFEQVRDPSLLDKARDALRDVVLREEQDPQRRGVQRSQTLHSWLHVVDVLDRSLDLNFDPNDHPSRFVLGPPLPGGVEPKGAIDPARIADPKVRAEYERAVAANSAKIKYHRFQFELRSLAGLREEEDERSSIPFQAKAFIRESYTAAVVDQTELKEAIEKEIKDPTRKAELLKLMRPTGAK